jgi:hypothetical protein
VIDDEVDVGARNERGELFEELQRLKGDVASPIAPWHFEPHEHASIAPKRQAVLRDGRPQEISAKALELGAVLGADGGVGVKVETTEAGLSPTFRGSGLRRRRVSEAEHRCTCASCSTTSPGARASVRLGLEQGRGALRPPRRWALWRLRRRASRPALARRPRRARACGSARSS